MLDNSIISRYIGGKAGKQEKAMLEDWLDESPENAGKLADYLAAYNFMVDGMQPEDKTRIETIKYLNSVNTAINKKVRARKLKVFGGVLAAACVVAAVAMPFLFKKGDAALPDNLCIISNSEAKPMKAFLPDSTVIWLAEGSRIALNPAFSSTHRQLDLEGECSFDVHHDPQHPFVVSTSCLEVCATGTFFKVSARKGDDKVETSLLEGTVVLRDLNNNNLMRMRPLQKVTYHKETKLMELSAASDEEMLKLRYGLVVLRNKTFTEIASCIEETFDIKLAVSRGRENGKRYTFSYRDSSDVQDVVWTLEALTGYKLRITSF